MARIQKKKPAFKRKKTKEDTSETQNRAGEVEAFEAKSSVPGESDSATDADKAKKKKRMPAMIQSTVSDQSAIMKLAEKYFGSWIQFFREVKVELSKVVWPTQKQTIGSTVVVIIFVFMIAIFLGAVDFGLSNIVRLIL
jgi:preprotein translocase subunit SecE